MAKKLTKKQVLILDFIRDFTASRGFSPSYREIAAGLSLNSVSAVAEHVDNLVTLGALKRSPGEARSLVVVDMGHPETVELFRSALARADEQNKAILLEAAAILELEL